MADGGTPIVLSLVIVLSQVLIFAIYASRYKRVPPTMALVVYGRKSRPSKDDDGFRVFVGGGRFITPIIETFAFLPLEPFVVEVDIDDDGQAAWKVLTTAKLSREPQALRRAARNLLNKSLEEIRVIAATVLEARARRILGRDPLLPGHILAEQLEVAVRPDYDALGCEIVGTVVVRPR